jgi:hypothetical protein
MKTMYGLNRITYSMLCDAYVGTPGEDLGVLIDMEPVVVRDDDCSRNYEQVLFVPVLPARE